MPQATLDEWRARLLDLTARNPMLATGQSERTLRYIRVIDEVPDFVFQRLVDGNPFTLKCLPAPPGEPPDETTQDFKDALAQAREADAEYTQCLEAIGEGESDDDSQKEAACERALRDRVRAALSLPALADLKPLSNRQIAQDAGLLPLGRVTNPYDLPTRAHGAQHEDSDLQTLWQREELRRKVEGLQAYLREDEEERGLQTLYIAFGFLEYTEKKQTPKKEQKPRLAPLVLLRLAGLKRQHDKDGQEVFRIRTAGEEPWANATLAAKLERDAGLKLPDFAVNDTPESYMDKVGRVVETRPGWRVRRFVTIGRFFSASQILLGAWPDHVPEDSALGDLLHGIPEAERDPGDPYPLDDPAHPVVHNTPLTLVLPADASQESAILAALHGGRSLVVQGPPGTGKSQTITNLIACALALRKRVLFMAEKKAALDVVHGKLEKAGLGPACLELHSLKATKRQVQEALKGIEGFRKGEKKVESPDPARKEAARARAALRAYSGLLQEKVGGAGTAHDAGWGALRHPVDRALPHAVRTLEVPWDLSPPDLEASCAALADLEAAAAADAAHGAGDAHPWAGAKVTLGTSLAVEDALEAVGGLREALAGYDAALPGLTAAGPEGWAPPEDLAGWNRERDLSRALETFGWENVDWVAVADLGPPPRDVGATPGGRTVVEALFGPGAQATEGRWAAARAALRVLEALPTGAEAGLGGPLVEPGAGQALNAVGAARAARAQDAENLTLDPSRPVPGPGLPATLSALAYPDWLSADYGAARTLYWSLARRRAPLLARLWTKATDMRDALLALEGYKAQEDEAAARWGALAGPVPWDAALALAAWADAARAELAPLGAEGAKALEFVLRSNAGALETLRRTWAGFTRALAAAERLDALALPPVLDAAARSGRGAEVARDLLAIYNAAKAHLERVQYALDKAQKAAGLEQALLTGPLDIFTDWCTRAAAHPDALKDRARLLHLRARAAGTPHAGLLDTLDREDLPCGGAAALFRALHHQALFRAAREQSPALDQQDPAKERDAFRKNDKTLLQQNGPALAASLADVKPPHGVDKGPVGALTDMALVERFVSKSMHKMTVRKLVARAGSALQVLTPCFLMSPFSAAQYLGGSGASFDLIIIDEASQMLPWHAVPALALAKQAVIVGDSLQSPPSRWFQNKDGDGDEGGEDRDKQADESILAEATAKWGRGRSLCVHYRSRRPALIQFSNSRPYLYNRTLTLFPAADDAQAVFYEYVVGGTYNERVNEAEARAAVAAAQAFMRAWPGRSLAIVTMNEPQQRLITQKMAEVFRDDPAARAYREKWDKGLEPFVVKTLENVQGDERDVVYLSTVYGPRSGGERVKQHFGPLITRTFGHRRLNVLVTRAKWEVQVFTSLTAADVTGAEGGPRMLREYLEYAASGGKVEAGGGQGGVESPFEAHVKAEVEALGWEAVPQVGSAGYRIDLGIRHPDWPHGFLFGLECDGAAYHASPSARERDAIRQAALEDLGWAIYRIWSTDWFRNSTQEMKKLCAFAEGALTAKRAEWAEDEAAQARARADLEAAALQMAQQADLPLAAEPEEPEEEEDMPLSRAAQTLVLLQRPWAATEADNKDQEEPEDDRPISQVGDTVVYTFDDEPGVQHAATIVDGPSSPEHGHLNRATALGRALLDTCAGDLLEVERPVGAPRRGHILEVRKA